MPLPGLIAKASHVGDETWRLILIPGKIHYAKFSDRPIMTILYVVIASFP
jgi:hypothetical protein